jgi:hypothetical protein
MLFPIKRPPAIKAGGPKGKAETDCGRADKGRLAQLHVVASTQRTSCGSGLAIGKIMPAGF